MYFIAYTFFYKNVLTIFFNDSHFIFHNQVLSHFSTIIIIHVEINPRQKRNLSTINIVLSILPPFPFSFFSFYARPNSHSSIAHTTRSSTANYFLVIFHRATSTTRATRCLIIAAKMILSMGLPSSPHPAKPVIIMPTPNTRSLLGITASKQGERRREGKEKSFLVKLLTALCISARETHLPRAEFELHESWNNRKRKSRVLACYPVPKTL